MGAASQLQHIVSSAAPVYRVALCVDNVAVVRYKALVAAFQLAHVLVNILAFHRNGTGYGFGLGSRVPLGGVLLRGMFAGGTAGGDQAGGAALPLGAVCGAAPLAVAPVTVLELPLAAVVSALPAAVTV